MSEHHRPEDVFRLLALGTAGSVCLTNNITAKWHGPRLNRSNHNHRIQETTSIRLYQLID